MLRATFAFTAALCALAPTAPAATVRMEQRGEPDTTRLYGAIFVTAAPGELNTIEISHAAAPGPGDVLTVRDSTTPLTGGGSCPNADPNTVRCQDMAVQSISDVVADLGDMDDRSTYTGDQQLPYLRFNGGPGNDALSGPWTYLYGEDGDDTLTGTDQREHLDGGPGGDLLEGFGEYDNLKGGNGNDILRGGDGGDLLEAGGWANEPGSAGEDLLDGGAGNDNLNDQDDLGQDAVIGPDTLIGGEGSDAVSSYSSRRDRVSVNLGEPGSGGMADEGDTLEGLENAFGGFGNDTLIGTDEPNQMDGGPGEDYIVGKGGADRLHSIAPANRLAGIYGPDAIDAGAGDDIIETLPTMESEIDCGPGTETVTLIGYSGDKAQSSLGPLVSRSCELITMSSARRKRAVTLDPLPVRRARPWLFFGFTQFTCCDQRIELKRTMPGSPTLARAKIRRRTVGVNVGHRLSRRFRRHLTTLRGKITGVAPNRFVWRFQVGEHPF